MIYYFMSECEGFEKALFISNRIISGNLYFQIDDRQEVSIYDLQHANVSIIAYILGQLRLYSYLCSSRNFLWKIYLQKIFHQEFLFQKIFDVKLNRLFRSAFAGLAHSMYIDYEPF